MCRERQRGERYYLKITHVGGAISRTILLASPIPEGCPEGLLHSPLETYKTLNRHISHGQFIIPFLRVSSTTARLNPLSHPTRRSSLINCSPRFFFSTFSLDGYLRLMRVSRIGHDRYAKPWTDPDIHFIARISRNREICMD